MFLCVWARHAECFCIPAEGKTACRCMCEEDGAHFSCFPQCQRFVSKIVEKHVHVKCVCCLMPHCSSLISRNGQVFLWKYMQMKHIRQWINFLSTLNRFHHNKSRVVCFQPILTAEVASSTTWIFLQCRSIHLFCNVLLKYVPYHLNRHSDKEGWQLHWNLCTHFIELCKTGIRPQVGSYCKLPSCTMEMSL